mmetsp:Transcript_30848/g.77677  ORF Transcript_30848/g.77677 Transcript_30848/m.77677 type:complete len:201 (-) Transcript_30848:548-1150(-)
MCGWTVILHASRSWHKHLDCSSTSTSSSSTSSSTSSSFSSSITSSSRSTTTNTTTTSTSTNTSTNAANADSIAGTVVNSAGACAGCIYGRHDATSLAAGAVVNSASSCSGCLYGRHDATSLAGAHRRCPHGLQDARGHRRVAIWSVEQFRVRQRQISQCQIHAACGSAADSEDAGRHWGLAFWRCICRLEQFVKPSRQSR